MTNVFYLVLRRIRYPLISVTLIYSICTTGLALMPGVDAAGNPTPGMGLFHAFYVISYTGSTIGFGEIPTAYSGAQRLWMTISIYGTVIGWSYTIVTVLGLDVGILVGGAILTETVFNIPGIGRLTFDAIVRGDIITVQGATLFLAFAVCICNLFVDVMYSVLDPRVRLS